MTDKGPQRASDVAADTDKDVGQLAREAARSRVASRKARADALRKKGALPPSSDDLAARIDHGLQARFAGQASEFRKRRDLVRQRVDSKRPKE